MGGWVGGGGGGGGGSGVSPSLCQSKKKKQKNLRALHIHVVATPSTYLAVSGRWPNYTMTLLRHNLCWALRNRLALERWSYHKEEDNGVMEGGGR